MKTPTTLSYCQTLVLLVSAVGACAPPGFCQAPLRVELSTIIEGDAEWDWTQARTAYVQTRSPYWVTTMSRTAKLGAHGYHDVFLSVSRDHGTTWSQATIVPSLRRSKHNDGYEVVGGDLWPAWHHRTSKRNCF